MRTGRAFTGAVLAGISIGLGGLAFLSAADRTVGAVLFAIGLFTICTFGLELFTGKLCYVFENGRDYALRLPVIWAGNLAGTGITALLARATRLAPALAEKASALCAAKMEDSPVSLFFLGVLCNLFIYIAVEGYRENPHEAGKYLSILFGVTGFVICGTEHCVADMFYFWMAGAWRGRAVLCLLAVTLGNFAGGAAFRLLCRMRR